MDIKERMKAIETAERDAERLRADGFLNQAAMHQKLANDLRRGMTQTAGPLPKYEPKK
jgi:hypothetical protein